MAANFPEVWLRRVEQKLTSADVAPWLDGIPELDVPVVELNEGSDSESNVIQIPTSDFEPDVLIDNVSPLDVQNWSDGTVPIQLNKYQTKGTSITDDQAIGAAYPVIDAATRSHVTALSKSKYKRAIYNLAPATNTAEHPILETSGVESANGIRKKFTYEDLVAMKKAFDDMDCPEDGRRIVLSTDHWNDLLLDRDRFANLLVNHATGQPAPIIAGFKVYSYIGTPYFDKSAGTRLAWGAAAGSNYRASIAFYEGNVAKRTGMTKQYFQPAAADPINQRNLLNYRHYFITIPKRSKYIGAIISKDQAGL